MQSDADRLSGLIIGASIEVHRALRPGLLESAYEECLCWELKAKSIPIERQVPLPIVYKGVHLDCGYVQDIVVDNKIIVELKAVEQVSKLHRAQLLSYLRLSNRWLGLLINSNVPLLTNGIERIVNGNPR